MPNRYFNNTIDLINNTRARASDVEANFDQIEDGFDTAQAEMDLKAPLASPALTGTPTAPTAAPNTNTTQLATTAYVVAERAATGTLTNKTINLANNTLQATSAQLAAAVTDETGTGSLVFANSPALTGTPTAPTAPPGTANTQIATTDFVAQQAFSSVLPGQTGNAGKFLFTNGTTASWRSVAEVVTYDNRNNLRGLTPEDGQLAVVEGLGLFRFVTGSTELDDDETCFTATGGQWLLEAASWELVEAMTEPNSTELISLESRATTLESVALRNGSSRILTGSINTTFTTVTANSQVAQTFTVTGAAVGDPVTVSARVQVSQYLTFYGYVSAANSVTIVFSAPSSNAPTLANPTTWDIGVIKV